MLTHYAGMKVVISEAVTDNYDDVPRTWRERLFTRPWRPRQKTKTVLRSPGFVVDEYHGMIYTTPLGEEALCKAVALGIT